MRFFSVVMTCLALTATTAWAQPPGIPPLPPGDAEGDYLDLQPDESEPETSDNDDDSLRPDGDVVVFANGRELAGVQVIRETARGVEVEVLKGSAPLIIPRRQVERIIYDDIDPRRPNERKNKDNDDASPNMLSADEVSPELHEKLMKGLSEAPIQIQDQDFIQVIEQTLGRAEIPLDINPLVREIPQPRRLWNKQIPAGINAFNLLRDHLVNDFPAVDVVFAFDKVMINPRRESDEPEP